VIDQAIDELAPIVGVKAACQAVGRPRGSHYRHHRQSPPPPKRERVLSGQPRALSEVERKEVLRVLHEPEHVDEAPATVYAKLLDQGIYLASTSTMYRILRAEGEVTERRRQATHPPKVKPELLATRPNAVWSWDIAKLLGPVKWTWFYLYTIIDIYSRYVPGWMLARAERAHLAERLLADTIAKQHVTPHQLTIHADRGASMASKPVAFLLADLGVTKSHSRPHCSNDNPYSEAQFKTLKYRPEFPDRFGSFEDAHGFCTRFFRWYNGEHRHSGIGFHTPPMSTTGGPNRSAPSGPSCWTRPTPPIPSGSSTSLRHRPSYQPQHGSTNPRTHSAQRIPDQPVSQGLTASDPRPTQQSHAAPISAWGACQPAILGARP
jgi:putative transposase